MDICSLDGAKRLQNYVANTVIGIIEEGDEVTILVYESVFGTEFRHLEEEYD
jgi:hypothetical protein